MCFSKNSWLSVEWGHTRYQAGTLRGSLLLMLAITLFCLPAQAKYGGGTGEPNDPYLIYTAEQMNAIGANSGDWDRHFRLMADIDLSVYRADEFNIIGNPPLWFCGTFDGGGHRIFNFTYHSVGKDNIALFGWVWDVYGPAVIRDLGLVDASVDAGSGSFVGALIGSFWGGRVTRCYVRGGTISAKDAVGALVGGFTVEFPHRSPIRSMPQGEISRCYTCCTVRGSAYVGGLVGSNMHRVSNCYSITHVYGNAWAGGLVGLNLGTISNCYAAGHVWGSVEAGGLVGIGYPAGVTNSFWDVQVSGWQLSAGGEPKTTAEMWIADTYLSAGWDFVGESENGTSDIWKLCEGLDYPHLACEKYGGGSGSTRDPYRICAAGQFRALGEDPNDWDKSFRLMADIDLAELGQEVEVIGNEEVPFTGTFDGNGKAISGFSCNLAYGDRIGLFGYVKGPVAKIENLTLVSPSVLVEAGSHVGALVGYLEFASLTGCSVEGGNVSGDQETGGLVGHNHGGVSNCHSSCDVSGTCKIGGLLGVNYRTVTDSSSLSPVRGVSRVGGLIGYNVDIGDVICCCAKGTVSAVSITGGLVGESMGVTKDSYAVGEVSGDRIVGGLVGRGDFADALIWNCYSTGRVRAGQSGGGLMADGGGETYSSFWDVETSWHLGSRRGTGKTTAEMQTASTFLGWGCDSAWTIEEGADYPRLRWENMPGQLLMTPSFRDIEGSGTSGDPYRIYTTEQLNQIGLFPCEWSKHYSLEEDIDLSSLVGESFNTMGGANISFTGVFDGNGHTISNFRYDKYRHFVGLFGQISSPAVVKRVILVNPSIEMDYGIYIAALVGSQGGGIIKNCGVDGGNIRSNRSVGGLVGKSRGTIIQCYATCNVSGSLEIGGLVGAASRANITDCYATGDVTATLKAGGGLVGWSYLGSIKNCYSIGQVVGSWNSGGLVGWADLTDGEGCLWDTQASGCRSSVMGIGRSTPYMQRALTFIIAGWDFIWEDIIGTDDIWCICEEQDYPKLTWQFTVGDFDDDGDVDSGDYGLLASRWHKADSSFWCGAGGADFTYDGYVDFADLADFTDNWLAGVE